MEMDSHPRTSEIDISQATHPACTGSFTGVGASTSGAGPSTSSSQVSVGRARYVCRGWVSQITVKKLKFIARQYKLEDIVLRPSSIDRPHLPPSSYMAFSEAIIKGRASLFLHHFIEAVL